MMDGLEDKLRRLAPRGPSPELDRRVLNALAAAPPQIVNVNRPVRPRTAVSVRWALAAALLMGLIGFFAGRTSRHSGGAAQTAAAPAVTVNVVYTGSAPNPFDCTVAADDGLRPVPEIKIDSKSGV